MYKPLADSTLHSMTKKEIIELLRIAEHNAKVSQEQVEQQAENIKDWVPVVHGRWIQVDSTKCRCSHCDIIALIALYPHGDKNFCPNCGAKMDGGAE